MVRSLNSVVATETNLPIKELADLNLALDECNKTIEMLDTQIKINNEGEESHKLAYFILSVLAMFFLIKALKPECIFGSSPDIASPVTVSSQVALSTSRSCGCFK